MSRPATRVLSAGPGPASPLLHRPETTGPELLDVLVGEVSWPARWPRSRCPPRPRRTAGSRHEVLTVIPYRQIAERGFAAADDGAPLIALTVTGQETAAARRRCWPASRTSRRR